MPHLPTVSWFPGHMAKAVSSMKDKLKLVDLVLEIRDARIPISSCNEKLEELVKNKRRIMILNKMDLSDEARTEYLCSKFEESGIQTYTSSITRPGGVDKILDSALERLRIERPNADMNVILVLGIPNVGKSTLINNLKVSAGRAELLDRTQAYRSAARTGPLPGVTRHLSGFKVCGKPLTYIMDTPGVMLPSISDHETALKLALTGAIKDSIIPIEDVAKYLIRLAMLPESINSIWQAINVPMPRPKDRDFSSPSASYPRGGEYDADADPQTPRSRVKEGGGVRVARIMYEAVHRPYLYTGTASGDEPPDEIAWRLNYVLQKMEGAKDFTMHASQRNIAMARLIRLFREGNLGRFTLD